MFVQSLSNVISSDVALSVMSLVLNSILSIGDLCVVLDLVSCLEDVVDMISFRSRMPSLIIVPRIRADSDLSVTRISNGLSASL